LAKLFFLNDRHFGYITTPPKNKNKKSLKVGMMRAKVVEAFNYSEIQNLHMAAAYIKSNLILGWRNYNELAKKFGD
jgi:hypothetical protein